ncbi:hypothetical protein J2W49_002364 [Hydrogenophaga palleronii]|uniref:DUF4124 domain-containing protein n=1 Tax=Hydrogenophaga palleronii TaxID=65655 RepID=A0ABU1WN24_9BURK|nr:hypothetical protein [Hydrogenophaga palleronii]MDR7150406.1 hypothetical protein [Hydrogenophaga palleronii]
MKLKHLWPQLCRSLGLAAVLCLSLAAQSTELVRWTDDGGRVYYRVVTDVPERFKDRAEPATAPLPADTTACERQWHAYALSAACFDTYRLVGGGLKPEAYQQCTEVPQPDHCN